MKNLTQISQKDNVAVALQDIKKGEHFNLSNHRITALQDILAGHKIALCNVTTGEEIIKYGYPIGVARCNITAGEWVHSHNLKSNLAGMHDYEYTPKPTSLPKVTAQTFKGFVRTDTSVGIRNEVWIIPTVGCVNATAKAIEDASKKVCTNTIPIVSYSHPYGCSQLGDDMLYTQKALCGLIHHPNAGGVLVLSLGCENNNISELKKVLGPYDERRVRFLVCQDHDDEIAVGTSIVHELCEFADTFTRTDCPVSKLIVGLKCGGSDGLSGITANPLTGLFSDILVSQGGSTIMTEVPEMFGAEQLLMNRCKDKNVFFKVVSLINNFKEYFGRYGEPLDENPSPGNKDGGITTLAEKSLGCVQKAGTVTVSAVLDYGEMLTTTGLNLLSAPGNDLVASCALAAAGAQLIIFTTGRGTPFGCPVPTVKVSSNRSLAQHKPHWIDFDASRILDSDKSLLSQEFFNFILSTASGEFTATSESLDKRDLSLFKDGVTL